MRRAMACSTKAIMAPLGAEWMLCVLGSWRYSRVRPEGQRERLDLKTHATHENALRHGSGEALQE